MDVVNGGSGMKEARNRGVKFGRRKKLSPAQVATARKLIDADECVEDVRNLACILPISGYNPVD
jgi:hypothetical protein